MDAIADGLLEFIDSSPSPYHAVSKSRSILVAAGFRELKEDAQWQLERGGGYFIVRSGKTILAWRHGVRAAAEGGFRLIVAHSDSPVLKLRSRPDHQIRNIRYFATEVYGSPLLHTWLDRDLKLAGAVFYRDERSGIGCGLVDLKQLRLRAASLAPHLKKTHRTNGVIIDADKDLPIAVGHSPGEIFDLIREMTASSSCNGFESVVGLDLCLADVQPGSRCGINGEFISAARLDNLVNCYTAMMALIGCDRQAPQTNLVVIYDSEEIGSQTYAGARSSLLEGVLQRIVAGDGGIVEDIWRAKSRSILLSADMAHAEHPSFPDVTDSRRVPEINAGLAIKTGSAGNYALCPSAEAWFEVICRERNIPLQRFMYRCGHVGGASIGPVVSANLGIAGLDIGAPMLAMHSAREMAGAIDVEHALRAFSAFYAFDDLPPIEMIVSRMT